MSVGPLFVTTQLPLNVIVLYVMDVALEMEYCGTNVLLLSHVVDLLFHKDVLTCCPICPPEWTSHLKFNLTEFMKHIMLFHSHQPGFSITCGLHGCLQTFKNFPILQNHMSIMMGVTIT